MRVPHEVSWDRCGCAPEALQFGENGVCGWFGIFGFAYSFENVECGVWRGKRFWLLWVTVSYRRLPVTLKLGGLRGVEMNHRGAKGRRGKPEFGKKMDGKKIWDGKIIDGKIIGGLCARILGMVAGWRAQWAQPFQGCGRSGH